MATNEQPIITVKGFDQNLRCRDYQCAIAGQEVKADTSYILNDLGEFEEVENV